MRKKRKKSGNIINVLEIGQAVKEFMFQRHEMGDGAWKIEVHTVGIWPRPSTSKICCHTFPACGPVKNVEPKLVTSIEVVRRGGRVLAPHRLRRSPALGPKRQKRRRGKGESLAAPATSSTRCRCAVANKRCQIRARRSSSPTRGSAGWPPTPSRLAEHVTAAGAPSTATNLVEPGRRQREGERHGPVPPRWAENSRSGTRSPPCRRHLLALGSSVAVPAAEARLRVAAGQLPDPVVKEMNSTTDWWRRRRVPPVEREEGSRQSLTMEGEEGAVAAVGSLSCAEE
uniref:Uncharacterized protein n=1 Tax=Oryza glumipatula TaxID=40148 RepID=A0A0E0B8J3_9ORYZ